MSHAPVTLLRIAPGQPWLRIDGFVTPGGTAARVPPAARVQVIPALRGRRARIALLAVLSVIGGLMAAAGAHADEAGERIYRHGLLPSGEALRAEREAGMSVEGAAAACVNCHRRSGLGMKEGRRDHSADRRSLPVPSARYGGR